MGREERIKGRGRRERREGTGEGKGRGEEGGRRGAELIHYSLRLTRYHFYETFSVAVLWKTNRRRLFHTNYRSSINVIVLIISLTSTVFITLQVASFSRYADLH